MKEKYKKELFEQSQLLEKINIDIFDKEKTNKILQNAKEKQLEITLNDKNQ